MIATEKENVSKAVAQLGLWDCTNAEYHAERESVSHSALEVFRRSIPLYHAQYITGEIERPTTEAMTFGSAVHAALLQPDEFNALVAVAPEGDRRTKEGKANWEKFQATANGKIVISRDQSASITAIVASFAKNSLAEMLLNAPGRTEQGIRWMDDTGLQLKCKPDRWLDSGVVWDLKTATDPSPDGWIRQAANLGYHRQAALYLEGLNTMTAKVPDFYFVVVGSTAPHEVVVYEIDQESIGLGHRQNHEDLRELAACRKSGQWLGRWHDKVCPARLPRWAFNSDF